MPIGLGAHRHPSGDAVQQTTFGVGGLNDVDGLGPQINSTVHIGNPPGPQERQKGTEAKVTGDTRRVTQGEPPSPSGA